MREAEGLPSAEVCAVCGGDAVLERVPCEDGHGTDCPELLCPRCGVVVVVGHVLDERRTA